MPGTFCHYAQHQQFPPNDSILLVCKSSTNMNDAAGPNLIHKPDYLFRGHDLQLNFQSARRALKSAVIFQQIILLRINKQILYATVIRGHITLCSYAD